MQRRILIMLILLLALAALALMAPLVPRVLIVSKDPEKSDAAIVLLGNLETGRTPLAAKLYREGFVAKIYLCGTCERLMRDHDGSLRYVRTPTGREYQRFLIRAGVSEEHIIAVNCPGVRDTRSELSTIAEALRPAGIKKVLLVTSASHTRRALWIWRSVAQGIEALPVAVPQPELGWWWASRTGRLLVAHELGGYVKELLRRAGIWR